MRESAQGREKARAHFQALAPGFLVRSDSRIRPIIVSQAGRLSSSLSWSPPSVVLFFTTAAPSWATATEPPQ